MLYCIALTHRVLSSSKLPVILTTLRMNSQASLGPAQMNKQFTRQFTTFLLAEMRYLFDNRLLSLVLLDAAQRYLVAIKNFEAYHCCALLSETLYVFEQGLTL